MGWSVSLPHVGCRLVCGLCLFLTGVVDWSVVWLFSSWGLWVGMLFVSLPRGFVDRSVSLPSGGCGLVCGLVVFLYGFVGRYVVCVSWGVWVGLCLFLARFVDWPVVCVSSLKGLWVGLLSLPLPSDGCGLVFGLDVFLSGVVGWLID